MALRTSTLPASAAQPLTPADWRRRVEDAVAAGAAALVAGDMSALGEIYTELATWDDRHRAYQARCSLTECVLAHRPERVDGWVPGFVTAAGQLLDWLERDPAEPTILNQVGVLLYELLELGGAEAMFKAVRRLDPGHPQVADNLAQTRLRKRAGSSTLAGPYGVRVRRMGARAKRVAATAQPARGLTLSLCMIVKDEQDMLAGCLAPLAGVVDEMIVVDTGSTDRTVELAESFGARVVHFPWNGSFSDARNASIEAASGDWIMYLDADEHMEQADALELRELTGRTWREGFYVVETNYTGGDEAGSATTHMALRMWRNRPGYRFEGRIHEQKTQTMPTYLPDRFEHTRIRVRHFGYLNQRIRAREKSQRNIQLLEQEARENPSPFNDYNLGSEHIALGDAQRARELLDRAWKSVRELPGWESIGYVPLLVSRTVRARRESGDLDAAGRAIGEGLTAFPDHTDLVLEQALCARTAGHRQEAAELCERCLAMGDAPAAYAATVGAGSFLALNLLAELRIEQRSDAEAERLLRRALADHPQFVATVFGLVGVLARRDASAEEIAAVVPAAPAARLLAATACYEAGRLTEADDWFRKVLAARPDNSAARVGLAEALLAQSRFGEAAQVAAAEPLDSPLAGACTKTRLFVAAIERQPDVMQALLAEHGSTLARGEPELFGAWVNLLEGDPAPGWLPPESAAAAGQILEALLRVREVGVFAGLLELFEAAATDERERREFLARMYLRRGFLVSAADEWIAVASAQPDARAMVGLAQVALAQGLPADAAHLAAEAVALDPADERAAQLHRALTEQRAQAGGEPASQHSSF